MKPGAPKIILLALAAAVLGVLLYRASAGKMLPPWPQKVSIVELSPVENQFGVVTGEQSVTTEKISFKGFWTWVAAFLTLCILSFLYDDNPFYKFAEHLFIGVSAAYWMVVGFWSTMVPNLFGKLTPGLVAGISEGLGGEKPNYLYLVPLVLGLLLLSRLFGKTSVYSRWALAFIVGTTAGLNFVQYLKSDFMNQIADTIIPLVVMDNGHLSLAGTFGNWVIFLGVLCGLVYFFFSTEHTGAFGIASRVGIWVLMISFGASFGFTVMGRIALLVGRMEYLLADWLNLLTG